MVSPAEEYNKEGNHIDMMIQEASRAQLTPELRILHVADEFSLGFRGEVERSVVEDANTAQLDRQSRHVNSLPPR